MNAEEIQRAKTFVKKKTIIIGITLLLDLNVKVLIFLKKT